MTSSWENKYRTDYKGGDKGQYKAWGKGTDPNPNPNPQNPFVASAQANQKGKGSTDPAPVYVAGVLQTPAWGGGWGPALDAAASGKGSSQIPETPQKKVAWQDQGGRWNRQDQQTVRRSAEQQREWQTWEEEEQGPRPPRPGGPHGAIS